MSNAISMIYWYIIMGPLCNGRYNNSILVRYYTNAGIRYHMLYYCLQAR